MPEQQSQSILTEDNVPLRFLQQNKDQQETKDEKQEERQQMIDEDLKVYTMPKQFVGAKEKKDKSENKDETGQKQNLNNRKFLFLLIPLIIVLLAGLAVAYFLVIKSPVPQSQPIEPVSQKEETVAEEETAPAVLEQQEPSVVIPPEPSGDIQEEPEEFIDIPEAEPEPILQETDQNLIQKIAVSYDNQGIKTTEAVLSLEPEQNIDYRLITIAEYVAEEKPELFSAIAGQPYKIELRGQQPGSASVLSITYSENLLENLDLIPADLRIGYLSFEMLAKDWYKSEQAPEIWQILKAQDLDDEVRSVSSMLEGVFEGIYAIVPIDINKMIDLPMPPEEIPAVNPEPQEIIIAPDSDNDLLTDKEELLYGTSPLVPDSDADNYQDGDEVLGLYSPARGAGVVLEEDSQFERWINSDYGYSVLKPRSFSSSPVDEESTKDIIFKSSDNESILISLQENSQKLPLKEWLLSVSPNIDLESITEFTTQSNFAALVSVNKTIYYIKISDQDPYIFVFSYNSPAEYSYMTTVRMMVESLQSL